jgi:hypothetical protein
MKTYTFIIGSADDFETLEDLIDCADRHHVQDAHWEESNAGLNYSIHEFEAPEGCDEETVTMIGRGIAFSNDWCMDHTFSFLMTGPLEGHAEEAMIAAGEKAREELKGSDDGTAERSAAQLIDVWCPNDPVTW